MMQAHIILATLLARFRFELGPNSLPMPTPALASLDRTGRVIHIGSFSKTISPTLRLGFLVAPLPLASRFADVAVCLAPPPGPSVQLAIAVFLREGHCTHPFEPRRWSESTASVAWSAPANWHLQAPALPAMRCRGA